MSELIGIVGATLVLGAFISNQLNLWSNKNWRYDFVNLVGSLLLVVYSLITVSYIFMIINLVWATFSLRDLIIRSK